jgi:hypothetical protein
MSRNTYRTQRVHEIYMISIIETDTARRVNGETILLFPNRIEVGLRYT